MAGPSNGPGGVALAAAPAWRNFTFFNQQLATASSSPALLTQPLPVTCVGASADSSLVVVGDSRGQLHLVDDELEPVKSWAAYEGGRVSHLALVEGSGWEGVVVSVGDEPGSAFSVLKVWDVNAPSPILLRSTRLTPAASSSRAPLSSLAVGRSLSQLVIGFTDGSVLSFRHPDQLVSFSRASASASTAASPTLSLGKLRVLHTSSEPVTGLYLSSPPPPEPHPKGSMNGAKEEETTLYVLTTNNVWKVALTGSGRGQHPASLDELGAGVGCGDGMLTREGGRLAVARDEAIYVYGPEGREGCFAYEGSKSKLLALSPRISSTPTSSTRSTYLVIVSPPPPPTSRRANGPSEPGSGPTKLTIFDPENKLVAYSTSFDDGVRQIWEARGELFVLTEGAKVWRLKEQPLASSLSTMFSRNLYTLAVSLAQSRNLAPSEVAEIYRRYGDYLYAKADYEGAMGCYLKTVGTVQASYVIRKFLDAQRLIHLTSYLQELHSRGLANSDHTTLLLNCYTKLADDTALSSFLHSSSTAPPSSTALAPVPESQTGESTEPPFDLETAIRVCRQAGYFEHAVWLAERYGAHADFLRIQIEDIGDVKAALRYLRTLPVDVAEHNLVRYGQTLLSRDPQGTTELLVDLCCGDLVKPEIVKASKENGTTAQAEGGLGYLNYLAYATGQDGGVAPLPPTSTQVSPRPDAEKRSTVGVPLPPSPGEITSLERAQAAPIPRQFFAHFVDHPIEFIAFLETVAERRFGKKIDKSSAAKKNALPAVGGLRLTEGGDGAAREEQAVWNTLLELYLSTDPASHTTEGSKASVSKAELEAKALDLLRSRETIAYDDTQALLVCTTRGFTPGFVLLYEQLGMYDDIIRYWIDEAKLSPQSREKSSQVIVALRRYGLQRRAYLYRLVLRFLSSSEDLLSRHSAEISELLEEIETHSILNPIAVVQILSASGLASVGVVREYLKRQLAQEQQETEGDAALISSYRTESLSLSTKIRELSSQTKPQIFQATRCSACSGQLTLPALHFLCQHSYHERCLPEGAEECPNCKQRHALVSEVRKAGQGWTERAEEWREDVREAGREGEGWNKVAESFGWGLMRSEE